MSFKVIGEVTSGSRIGRELGFPTANITLAPGTEIPDGVWAGRVTVDGAQWNAVVNIGANPTIEGQRPRRLEAHLIGFDGTLYGKTVEVTLLEFLRPEKKFTSREELQEQIAHDKTAAEEYFNSI